MSGINIMLDIKANSIAYTRKVIMCNPEEEGKIKQVLSEKELSTVFIIPHTFCEKGKVLAITDFNLAKGLVMNELQKQKEKGD